MWVLEGGVETILHIVESRTSMASYLIPTKITTNTIETDETVNYCY